MRDNGSGMNILYISYIYIFFLWLGHPTLMFLLLAKNANVLMYSVQYSMERKSTKRRLNRP